MWSRLSCLAILLLVAACAPSAPSRMVPISGTVLCLDNQTAGYGTHLTLRAGPVTFRTEAGRRECKVIPGHGRLRVWGVTNGGGANGPLRVTDEIELDGGCWEMTVGHGPLAQLLRCRGDEAAGAVLQDSLPPGWFRVHRGMLGFTVCLGAGPEAWVKMGLPPDSLAMIVEHERQHMEDMARIGCAQHNARSASLRYRLVLEARGYCRSARAAVRTGKAATLEEAALQWSEALAWMAGWSHTDAARLILRACRDLP